MKRIRVILTIAILVVTAVVASGVRPANAFFTGTTTDSFENNPSSVWTIEAHPANSTNYGSFNTSARDAHSGSNWVYLSEGSDPSGWTAVGRTFTFPQTYNSCMATVYIAPWVAQNPIAFEIIDPATWTYVSLKTVTLSYTTGGYTPVQTAWWPTNHKSVYVRISLAGGSTYPRISVDDVSLTCNL